MGCKKISIAVCAYLFGLREGSVAISLLRSEMLVAYSSAVPRVRCVRKVREIPSQFNEVAKRMIRIELFHRFRLSVIFFFFVGVP